jgi:hypothetical protein
MKRIDKFMLLQVTNGGLDFYQFVFKNKLIPVADQNKMENVLNPFYEDTKPAFSIYLKSSKDESETDKWCFNDFGDESFFGDVFDFAGFYYDLDVKQDFNEIVLNIIRDLNIKETEVTQHDIYLSSDMQNFCFEIIYFDQTNQKEFTENYFLDNYSIPYSVCLEYGARAIKGYRHLKGGKIISFNVREKEVLIAYTHDGYAKLYQPLTKNPSFRFSYLGKKPKDYIFGWNQILNRIAKYKNPRNILILTGGEKDVLSLATLGYDAICFNSETASIPSFAIDNIFPYYDKIFIMYDNDETGLKSMEKISKQHKIAMVKLPTEINNKTVKDISDCMKYKIESQVIDDLIADAELIYKDVLPINQDANVEMLSNVIRNVELRVNKISQNDTFNPDETFLPQTVYDNLPSFFKKICGLFDDGRSKDLVLLSSLTVLSTCFPKVKGLYKNELVGANLYFFITAPPASGKGDVKWSRKLTESIEEELKTEYGKAMVQYRRDTAEYEEKKVDNFDLEKPIEPIQQIIMIPANSSATKMIEMLGDNGDFGLIFETEGDVVSNALKSDWSDYSSTLRAAFHHEPISLARKGGRGYFNANSPHLSVLLTGTPNQINNLINNVENGLMSRFLFYNFEASPKFINPFKSSEDYNKIFKLYSRDVLSWWHKQQDSLDNFLVSFNTEQQILFSDWFNDKTKELSQIYGNDLIGSIMRLGLSHFRICVLLTVIRQMENNHKLENHMTVNDTDFILAFDIIETLLKHTKNIFSKLTESDFSKSNLKYREQMLFNNLPTDFTWEECKDIAKLLEIPENTAGNYIRKFETNKLILRVRKGSYHKQI